MRIVFCCLQVPAEGGETPIADSRVVYRAIAADVRRRFEDKRVSYVRNYGHGIDLSWQEAFQTADRGQVEMHCHQAPMQWEWLGTERLRTRQVRPATAVHPVTGEALWFNQAHLFHVSNLGLAGEQSLRQMFADEDLPRNSYFGDGSTISREDLEEVRRAYRASEVLFRWQQGDVLLLDNMLVAHGRNPFRGERKVLTAMVDPYTVAAE